jgi:hypothetical protein
MTDWRTFEHEHRAMLAVAQACHASGSPSWHVFEWMCWKLRMKYSLIVRKDSLIDWNGVCT